MYKVKRLSSKTVHFYPIRKLPHRPHLKHILALLKLNYNSATLFYLVSFQKEHPVILK